MCTTPRRAKERNKLISGFLSYLGNGGIDCLLGLRCNLFIFGLCFANERFKKKFPAFLPFEVVSWPNYNISPI